MISGTISRMYKEDRCIHIGREGRRRPHQYKCRHRVWTDSEEATESGDSSFAMAAVDKLDIAVTS